MHKWRVIHLGEIAQQVTVGHVGPMADEYVVDGVPFLRSLNVKPFAIDTADMKNISREFHDRLNKSALTPGDVVMVRTGKPGSCAVIPDWLPEANCSDLVIVRPGPEIDSRFLMYYVNTAAAEHIGAHLVGAVQQHFNVASAKQIKLHLPPLPEQQAIVEILGALDDKIELNRKMNATLDELARTIFRSWFVDFDPVHAKAEGRAPFGMDADTAALFPDRFVDSELGPIPEGWLISTIGNEVRVVGGSTPSTKNPDYWEGGINVWVTPKDLSGLASPILIDSSRKITDAGVDQISSRRLPIGTVLLSSRAPVGYLALTTEPTSINQGFIAMVCDQTLPNLYVLNWARESMEAIKSNAGGTTFAEISKSAFRPIKVLVPNDDPLRAFQDFALPLYEMIEQNLRESSTLAELRDTLLPELISGRIRVPEAEKLVGEAV